MARVTLDLFVEDRGHEEFLNHLVRRIAAEEQSTVLPRVISARGGHGRALAELRVYQRWLARAGAALPDVIVVAIDANCQKWNSAKNAVVAAVEDHLRGRTVVACPDPHIERWYLADPTSFRQVVGAAPEHERVKCERDRYKELLRSAVRRGGYIPTLGGIEFAGEIVEAMDLYRAGRSEPSLAAFVDAYRASVRTLQRTRDRGIQENA